MDHWDKIRKVLEKELGKDAGYVRYALPSGTGEGELYADGEKFRTPAYSFTEMSEIVRSEFERKYPVRQIVPIGFRGERFVSDEKELEVYATGSAGLIEYRVNMRAKEALHD